MDEFKFQQTHRVLDYPDYKFEIEEYRRGQDQLLLVNFDVHKWSRSVFRRILDQWRTFRSCVSAPLFAFGETDDAKWEHFVRALGFKPHMDITCNSANNAAYSFTLRIAHEQITNDAVKQLIEPLGSAGWLSDAGVLGRV